MLTRGMLLLVAGVAVCAAPAQAVVINYTFPLTVDQEVPAPTIVGLTPAGVGIVDFDTDSNLLSWTIYYAGLSGPIVAPGAHFHGPASFGVTAPAEVFIAGGSGLPLPQPSSGALIGSATLTPAQEADLLAGLWYVNLHTERNPAGEIRGQVVPEPATLALLAAGFGLIGYTRARRR